MMKKIGVLVVFILSFALGATAQSIYKSSDKKVNSRSSGLFVSPSYPSNSTFKKASTPCYTMQSTSALTPSGSTYISKADFSIRDSAPTLLNDPITPPPFDPNEKDQLPLGSGLLELCSLALCFGARRFLKGLSTRA